MGKVEDMRRQRELIYAQNERAAQARAAAASKATAEAAPPAAPARTAPAAVHDDDDDELSATAEPADTGELGPGVTTAAPRKATGKLSRPARGGRAPDEHGACSVCGKQRPLQAGMVSSHQKGFGKACPGSRKPPAGA